MNIQTFRVEVLDSTTHKYASTEVHGGGGYVATSGNGMVHGATAPIRSTVTHHVEQDLWVRDITSGREFPVRLKARDFAARPGHVLRITFDEGTGSYERVHNEATQATCRDAGVLTDRNVRTLRARPGRAWLYAIGLTVPLLNWLVGIVCLALLVTAPMSVGKHRVNEPWRFLRILGAGLGVVVFSFMGGGYLMIGRGFAEKSLGMVLSALYVVSVLIFITEWRTPYDRAADFIEQRGGLHDDAWHAMKA